MGSSSSRRTVPGERKGHDQMTDMPPGTPVQPPAGQATAIRNETKQLALLVTPRREDALYSKISYTPMGEQADMYKYYCPLCMFFFRDILKSACCGNYICSECCVDFISKHQQQVETISSVLAAAPYQNMCCPNCNTSGFNPVLVAPSDAVRDYSDGCPAPVASVSTHMAPSPMKIGDSFEDMKRKMIRHNNPRSTASPSSTAVIISSNSRLRTFSPDASLDRLIATPLEFDALGAGPGAARGEGGLTETRPVQLSARREGEEDGGEGEHEEVEDCLEQGGGSDSAARAGCPRHSSGSAGGHSGTNTPLRGIALSASSSLSRRGSRDISESYGGRYGENVRTFATQFVSSVIGNSGIPRRPSGGKVTPLGSPLVTADDINGSCMLEDGPSARSFV